MSFEMKYKKPIPTEQETRANILIVAGSVGCQEETKRIFKFFDSQMQKEKNDMHARQKIAESCILELHKLDKRLVYPFLNENGEIIVGNKVILKLNKNDLKNIF